VQITIPLKFHWIGTRSTWQNDTQYLEQYILLALQKALTVDNIPSLRATLGLDRIKTVVTNREYGAETLDGVFDNIDLRLPLDMAAAMLEVDLTITGDLNCIVGASCPTIADLLLLESGDFILTETNDFIEI